MTIKEYAENAKRTIPELGSNSDFNLDVNHMLMGMTTEVGELVDIFKKNLAYKKQVDIINVKEEVGDLLWYIANFCNLFNFDIENDILEMNINKLKVRYPDKFTENNAIHRNLEKERKVMGDAENVIYVRIE